MNIHDNSERSLASLAYMMFLKGLLHGKWNFLLFGIDNSRGLTS